MPVAKPPVHRIRSTGAPLRLAAAITISALFHAWLATGLRFEPAGHALQRPGVAIQVRLEPAQPPVSFSRPRTTAILEPVDAVHEIANRASESRSVREMPGVRQSAAANQPKGPIAEPEITAAPAPGLIFPATPDPVYYPARLLDVYPALPEPAGLIFPERAARDGVNGKVTMLLLIGDNGIVNEIKVVEAEPAGYFEDVARIAFIDKRFIPARKDGRAVKSQILISISFGTDQAQNDLHQRPR